MWCNASVNVNVMKLLMFRSFNVFVLNETSCVVFLTDLFRNKN